MLKTLAAAAAVAAPLSKLRRLRLDCGFLLMIISPTPKSPIFYPTSTEPRPPRAGHQRSRVLETSLPRFTSRDDNTIETTTSTIAKIPAAAAVGSNLYRREIYIA